MTHWLADERKGKGEAGRTEDLKLLLVIFIRSKNGCVLGGPESL